MVRGYCYSLIFCQMYVALFPCNECAKVMIQSGIREIVYVSDKYHNNNNMIASRRLLDMAGVSLLYFKDCSEIC